MLQAKAGGGDVKELGLEGGGICRLGGDKKGVKAVYDGIV